LSNLRGVAIVGGAPEDPAWSDFVLGRSDVDYWGFNELYCKYPGMPWARWFELHANRWDRDYPTPAEEHIKALAALQVPVYMWQVHPAIPNSVVYPAYGVTCQFGRYATGSAAWLIALAIWEKRPSIYMYGINTSLSDEYRAQRSCLEYYIGWARGKGIEVHLSPTCDLLKAQWLYGLADPPQTIGGNAK